jgi:hypothetical protein
MCSANRLLRVGYAASGASISTGTDSRLTDAFRKNKKSKYPEPGQNILWGERKVEVLYG